MSMTATARPTGTGLEHEVDVNGRHIVVTDEPERLGGTDRGPAPHELLPATLASCVATMIAMYAQNRGWELGEMSVEVDYDPKRVPRLFTIDLHLPDGLTLDRRRRLERVAETCPVRRALEGGFEFHEHVSAQSTQAA
jgi:putative redox protein